jgi:hypothetical protein
MKTTSAVPWARDPRGLALFEAATRGGRLDRGAALVLGDCLDEADHDRLAAAVRALARAGLAAAEDPPPAPTNPDGLAVRWHRGRNCAVWLSLRAGGAWLHGPDGRGRCRLLAGAGYVTYGEGWAVPAERRPGRVYFVLKWYGPGLRHLPDPRRVYLDTPPWYPIGELAALAFEAAAAVLVGRLLGRHGAPGDEVVVRA